MKLRRLISGHGSLALLAVILASSGAMRLGHGVGAAMALQAETPEDVASAPLQCPEPPIALAEALKERDLAVSAREAALNDRMAALAIAEKAIETRMVELETAEARLKETLAVADGAAEKDIQRLTTVYETMKPADAAALFETMSPEFAAGFLGRMRPDAAAAVISGMKAETAYAISVLIAGRNALVPKE